MKSGKIILVLIFIIPVFYLSGCNTDEILLHGDISGYVTDTETGQPIQAADVILNPVNDTAITAIDGKYIFTSLLPGNYVIETYAPPYARNVKNVIVTSANSTLIDFDLHKIPYPGFSERHLDFGFDSISKSFTITNTGTGKLNYSLITSQDWITVSPDKGEITTGTVVLKVTINRNNLSEKKHIESIEVVSHAGQDLVRDSIFVYLNGLMDRDYNYYNIVTIGTQIWMAENLNTGVQISNLTPTTNNKIIEKYCYDDNKNNCSIYGGLYTWPEMMDYNPSDNAVIGTTQGICPVGWHIPTQTEYLTLNNFVNPLGQINMLGNLLKETGAVHWEFPNSNATDEFGFTALPGGVMIDFKRRDTKKRFDFLGQEGHFWQSQEVFSRDPGDPVPPGEGVINIVMYNYDGFFQMESRYNENEGVSVRCVKDPLKK